MSSIQKQQEIQFQDNDSSYSQQFAPDSPYNQISYKPSRSSRVHMYELNDIAPYYVMNHPILSKSKKKLIEEKLNLDEQVRKQINIRQQQDNFFVKYLRNPFSNLSENKALATNEVIEEILLKNKRRTKVYNQRQFMHSPKNTIIDAVNELQENKFIDDSKYSMHKIASYKDFSASMVKNAQQSRNAFKSKEQKLPAVQQQLKAMSLEQILEMDDYNFYAANLKDINIFQIVRNNHKPLLTRQTLDKYKFSFNSMAQKIEKIKFPIFRDLSRLGRNFILNKNFTGSASLDLISSFEMAVKANDIRFEDLMSLSSGRFTPEIAYIAVNQRETRKQFSPSSSEVGPQEIAYSDNVFHQMNNCKNINQERQQIFDYQFLQSNESEKKFERFCDRIQNNIKADLKIKQNLVKNTIQDVRQHRKINAAVEENIGYLANLNPRGRSTSVDRLIKQNKGSKNRKETLQIRKLLQTISLKNRQEEKIQQLLRGNSKK